ncbi:MAG TPA: DUF5683 domain-containing protein, partial [Phnomibacter sp.]|nr:DUF5683 domain-containing protein [Phnomibacter sp.]
DSVAIADSLRKVRIRRTIKHSAIIPGWGQINNRQIWKVPLVYGGLGFTGYVLFYNLNEYKSLRQAYIYKTDTIPDNDDLIPDRYKPLSNNSIRFYRDEFRKNVDYSVLAMIILWGLNVVDAAVFANLRDFDVSDDLSLRLHTPNINIATGQGQMGITLQLKPANHQLKPLPGR